MRHLYTLGTANSALMMHSSAHHGICIHGTCGSPQRVLGLLSREILKDAALPAVVFLDRLETRGAGVGRRIG